MRLRSYPYWLLFATLIGSLAAPLAAANPLRAARAARDAARVLLVAPVAGRAECAERSGEVVAELITDLRSAQGLVPTPAQAGTLRDLINPKHGTQNCVSCAIALDHTLAGQAASALATNGPQRLYDLQTTYALTSRDISRFGSWESFLDFARRGDYERAIVLAKRPGDEVGHLLNLAVRDRVPYLLDGQAGTTVRLNTPRVADPGYSEIFVARTDRELPALKTSSDHIEIQIETETGDVLHFP